MILKFLFIFYFFFTSAFSDEFKIIKRREQSLLCEFDTDQIYLISGKNTIDTIWDSRSKLSELMNFLPLASSLILDSKRSKNKNICKPFPDFNKTDFFNFESSAKLLGPKFSESGYYVLSSEMGLILFLDKVSKNIIGTFKIYHKSILDVIITKQFELYAISKSKIETNLICLEKWNLVSSTRVWKNCNIPSSHQFNTIRLENLKIMLQSDRAQSSKWFFNTLSGHIESK